jgi:D-alanine---D-serine ligase
MEKVKVAVIFGGCSSEYCVSLESAYSVICHLNKEKYIPVMLGITRQGAWYYYSGDVSRIPDDTWYNEEDCIPAVLSSNKGDNRNIILRKKEGTEFLTVDAVFPVLHGKNGEDGTVQGLIELTGLPLVGCGTLASALCMDKDRAHKLAHTTGVRIPRSVVFTQKIEAEVIDTLVEEVGLPLYIKPVKAGSSYGITKVQKREEMEAAIECAFQYDNQVMIEENIEGFEVGCAVLGIHYNELLVGEVDEIELSSGFFDFTEKYTLKTSAIHVPGRIAPEKAEEIKSCAKRIYQALGCSGFARVDLFLTPEGEIVFNEVNTIPGFTEHSRYPAMMKAAGYSFSEILELLIEQAVSEWNKA